MSAMVIIALSITFITMIFSKLIIIQLFGVTFNKAAQVLNIYIWASVFVFLGVVTSKWYIIENLNKLSFYRSLFSALLNILLNYILIPIYGINGAAISTLIAYSIQVYFSNLFFKKTRQFFYLQTNALFLIYPLKYCINFVKKNL